MQRFCVEEELNAEVTAFIEHLSNFNTSEVVVADNGGSATVSYDQHEGRMSKHYDVTFQISEVKE